MHGFKLSLLADSDVFDVLDYTIEKWGYEQAEKYKNELEAGRTQIQEDPYLAGSKKREDLAPQCRSYRANHHYFFYRVNENEKVIEIARILHEQMNFPEHIREEYFPNA